MDVHNRAERQSVDGWWTGLSERELAEELTRMLDERAGKWALSDDEREEQRRARDAGRWRG